MINDYLAAQSVIELLQKISVLEQTIKEQDEWIAFLTDQIEILKATVGHAIKNDPWCNPETLVAADATNEA